MRHLTLIAVLFALGCATAEPQLSGGISNSALTSGEALFGASVDAGDAPAENVLGLNDEMRAFVLRHTNQRAAPANRLRRLMKGLIDEGYFNLDYNVDLTLSASGTFESRAGNCLSFTNLFVALAREAGVPVSFQMVEVPPVWEGGDDWVMLNNHINVIAHDVRVSQFMVRDYVVDFNTADFRGNFDTEIVDDTYAFALFYSNRGVESMRAGKQRLAFAYFRKAIDLDARITGPWVNLGVLYSRGGQRAYAEAAYLRALEIDPGNKSALTNLAHVYLATGRDDLAAELRKRIDYYQRRNPYYHYWLARKSFAAGDLSATSGHLSRAIVLKDDESRFYFLKGMVEFKEGDLDAARRDLSRASAVSTYAEERQRYNVKLAALQQ